MTSTTNPNEARRVYACRFCRHDTAMHNLIQGCSICTCMATPGEGGARTDAEMAYAVLPEDRALVGYELRSSVEPQPEPLDELLQWATERRDGEWFESAHEAYNDMIEQIEVLQGKRCRGCLRETGTGHKMDCAAQR